MSSDLRRADRTPTPAVAALADRQEGICEGCGRALSPQVARVVGDNDGNVPACDDCYDGRRGTVPPQSVAAAVKLHRRDERGFSAAKEGSRR